MYRSTSRLLSPPQKELEADPLEANEINEPLQPVQISYRAISTVRSACILGSIIVANCFCSGSLCLCFWGFSKINDFTLWQKRGFNALSLLLSGALGFGIGFLCDWIGLLARGPLLQSKPHSARDVCTNLVAL